MQESHNEQRAAAGGLRVPRRTQRSTTTAGGRRSTECLCDEIRIVPPQRIIVIIIRGRIRRRIGLSWGFWIRTTFVRVPRSLPLCRCVVRASVRRCLGPTSDAAWYVVFTPLPLPSQLFIMFVSGHHYGQDDPLGELSLVGGQLRLERRDDKDCQRTRASSCRTANDRAPLPHPRLATSLHGLHSSSMFFRTFYFPHLLLRRHRRRRRPHAARRRLRCRSNRCCRPARYPWTSCRRHRCF